jgi:tetratricopeptide (TPR) repeat protein
MSATSEDPPTAPESVARVAAGAVAARAARLGPLIFFLVLIALGTLAVAALVVPPPRVAGLPDDGDVAAARALLGDRVALRGAGALRLHAALLGDLTRPPRDGAGSGEIARALRHLEAARRRHPFDARVRAALGAVELIALRLAPAERRYREALDLSPRFAEARLGLGVVLAIRAGSEGDPARARGLRLRALAQWRAVPSDDPSRDAALYNGAMLLAEAGWLAEAERWAGEYRSRDPHGRWADAVRAALAAASERAE